MTLKKNIKFLFALSISALCMYVLFQQTDISSIQAHLHKLNYLYLLPFIVLIFLANLLSGWRLYFLLSKDIKFSMITSISMFGAGLNLVLPARGGEILRVFLTHKHSKLGSLNILGRFFLEKNIDLVMALLGGLIALYYLWEQGQVINNPNFVFVKQSLSILLPLALVLIPMLLLVIKYKTRFLITCVRKLIALLSVTKAETLGAKLEKELPSLATLLTCRNLAFPLFLSIVIWLGIYAYGYTLAGLMLGWEWGHTTALFLLFAGSMGFMLPAAPSGIGVVHASLSSAMVLLGYELSEGLVLALVFHLCLVASQAFAGLCGWFYYSFHSA